MDVQDGDYALLDVSAPRDGKYPLLDGWHESYPLTCRPIAASFREFLERALSGGVRLYWLNE